MQSSWHLGRNKGSGCDEIISYVSLNEKRALEEESPGYFGDEYEVEAPIHREQASKTPRDDVDDKEDFDYR